MDPLDKTKVEIEIDLNLPAPRVTRQDWMRESIESHLNCVLCGSEVIFERRTDFIAQTVREDAHCPGCRARRSTSYFGLQ